MRHDGRLAELDEISRERALTTAESVELANRHVCARERHGRLPQRIALARKRIRTFKWKRDLMNLRLRQWRKRLAALEAAYAPALADTIEQELARPAPPPEGED